ncbi:hypothetical protein RIF29_39509 [Crotalaria pallida]|uniref:Uncharacterized protein n=1 Tax=Crotalaria pallida TaxID=3830 RepID=A0AAN9E1A7_CROPI
MDSENVENGNKMRRRSRSDVDHGVQADEGNLSKSISSYRSRRTVLKDVTNIAEDSSLAEQGNCDRPSLANVVANICIDELMVGNFGGNSVVPQCNKVKRCKSVVQNAKRDLGSEFNKVAVFETMKNEEDNFEGSGVDQRSECIVECGEGSSNPRKRRRSLKSERDGVSLQLQNVEKLGGGPCSNRRKRRRSGQKLNRNSTFEYDDLNDATNGKDYMLNLSSASLKANNMFSKMRTSYFHWLKFQERMANPAWTNLPALYHFEIVIDESKAKFKVPAELVGFLPVFQMASKRSADSSSDKRIVISEGKKPMTKALLQINSDDYATDNTNFLSLASENASNSAVKLDTACSSVTPDNSKKKKGKGISEEDIEEILGNFIMMLRSEENFNRSRNLKIKQKKVVGVSNVILGVTKLKRVLKTLTSISHPINSIRFFFC